MKDNILQLTLEQMLARTARVHLDADIFQW